MYENPKLTGATNARIATFVDWFIRSEYVQNWTSEKDSDFINEPDRASRCYDAAEFGADGKTHADVIEDWREAFECWLKYDHRRGHEYPYRFSDAVTDHFDAVELWHENSGSLREVIG